MKKIALLFVALTIICHSAFGKEINIPAKKAEAFLVTVLSGDVDGAYDTLLAGTGWAKMKPQVVTQLKQQTKMIESMYGKAGGFDLVGVRNFGTNIYELIYSVRTPDSPLIWDFYFYRPDLQSDWNLVKINFDDELKGLEHVK